MFKAGASRIVITPPVGVELAGDGFGPSVGILDELEAHALFLSHGETSAAIVTTDLLMLGTDTVINVRRRIQETIGIPGENVILSASHSHSTPSLFPLRQWGIVDEAYRCVLEAQLVGLVNMACGNAQEARLGIGLGHVNNISENRRILGGPTDPELPVLRIDEAPGASIASKAASGLSNSLLPPGAPTFLSTHRPPSESIAFGKPIAVLTSFGCHPVTVHSYGNLYSADYPGHLRSVVRSVLGQQTVVMFTLGLAGDINPAGYVRGGTSPAWARQIGSILGCEAARVALDPLYVYEPQVRTACTQVDLPLSPLPPAKDLRKMAEQFAADAIQLEAKGVPWKEASIPAIQRDWAQDALREWEQGQLKRTISCELQALRIGPVGLLACPLELFTETGMAIRQESPADITVFVTNANGGIGYLPTRDAYSQASDYANPQGLAPKVYGIYALAEDAEPQVRQAAFRLLKSLF